MHRLCGRTCPSALAPAAASARLPWRAPPQLPLRAAQETRAFGTTDGPFRHIAPKGRFVDRKKHYGQVLVMADVRMILETAEDALRQPGKEFPLPFWEVLAKRCIQSMHLFKPLELAMIARAFDTHDVKLKPRYDVYVPIVAQAAASKEFPGLAILVLTDVLPRRVQQADLMGLLGMLGRQAADVMWQLTPKHAVAILEALTSGGVRDRSLTARVAKKVSAHLVVPGAFGVADLAKAASVLAGQEHRDLQTLRGIADAVVELCEGDPSSAGADAARRVVAAFQALEVDEVPERLLRSAAAGVQP